MSKKVSALVSKEVAIFRGAVKKVVTILAGRDLKVIERGDQAYVLYNKDGSPKLICIPSIPDNASKEYLMAIRGFIDHEVAHILFTDQKCVFKMFGEGGLEKAGHFVWNSIEDTYIERKMAEIFAGSKSNLINTQQHVLEKVFIPQEEGAIASAAGDQFKLFKTFFLNPALRAWAGSPTYSEYMEDRWSLVEEPVAALLAHDIDEQIPLLGNTQECLDMAGKLCFLLKKAEEEMKEEEKRKSSKGKPKPSKKRSKSSEKSESMSSGGSSSDDEDDEKHSPGSDSSEEEESPDTGDETTEEGDDGEKDGDEDDKDGKSDEKGDAGSEDDHESALLEEETAPTTSIEDAMKSIIKSEAPTDPSYRPYERTFDYLGPIEGAEAFLGQMTRSFPEFHLYSDAHAYHIGEEGAEIFKMAIEPHFESDHSANLAKDLERAIASKNRTQFVPGQRKGRIHGPSLFRLSLEDDRVFRTKEEKRAVNACVQLVIDMSGSMNGRRIRIATAAAYVLSDALDRIKVPNIITGFTTSQSVSPSHMARLEEGFSRVEALFLPTIKSWGARANSDSVRRALGCVADSIPLVENVDGESIAALLSHFADRREDKKIMIVLSDGSPCARAKGLSEHLKKVTRTIEAQNEVSLIGVGIETKSPANFYKNNICLKNVSELGETLINTIRQTLLG